jgi:hypothetical protein
VSRLEELCKKDRLERTKRDWDEIRELQERYEWWHWYKVIGSRWVFLHEDVRRALGVDFRNRYQVMDMMNLMNLSQCENFYEQGYRRDHQ